MDITTPYTIALAGNPNVGKSTIFNALTGLHQHTGNWSGKTVANATGTFSYQNRAFCVVDLPGTYSLHSCSQEEKIAESFIRSGEASLVVCIADATCLQRNLILVQQILALSSRVVLCVNLLDEAEKKGIFIDLTTLSTMLGIPVIGTSARNDPELAELKKLIYRESKRSVPESSSAANRAAGSGKKTDDTSTDAPETLSFSSAQTVPSDGSDQAGTDWNSYAKEYIQKSLHICEICILNASKEPHRFDRRVDKILTSRRFGIPLMILMLCGIFWITITGANYPSQLLSSLFQSWKPALWNFLDWIGCSLWLQQLVINGLYTTLTWVISVMLPPMAIFFPLFTLLEDSGYLPRIAFNLDHFFQKANAHGKQALTMCMGFGCNACGVVGCRIIDSPRERLIAILTNNFVPCNGRFPTLIALITIFFAADMSKGAEQSILSGLLAALLLTAVIVLGIVMTILMSKLLSVTVLKGVPSSFTLELPPYRKPQWKQVIIRSVLDRTLFVLGRAILIAAPAGVIIWLAANTMVGDQSLFEMLAGFFDPFAQLIGIDGVILLAFLFGFPANEIVIPIMLMAYLSAGTLVEYSSNAQLYDLLAANGWTWVTALCTILLCLMHFPCGTTCLTIFKETKSLRWTGTAILLPTVCGLCICFLVNLLFG